MALVFTGICSFNAMKVSLSVAIIDIVAEPTNGSINATENIQNKYNWTRWDQGLLLSSSFFICVLSPIPAGILTIKYGGKTIVLIGATVMTLSSLLSPVALFVGGYGTFMSLRIIQGFFYAFALPGFAGVLSHWMPELERTSISIVMELGSLFGPVIGVSLGGIICENLDWTAVYYIFSAFGIFWVIIWGILATNTPEDSCFTSQEEIMYIRKSCQISELKPTKCKKIPWKSLIQSSPAWALGLMGVVEFWSFTVIQTLLPTFLSDRLHVRIDILGLVSSLPYLLTGIMLIVSSQLADLITKKRLVKTTALRKIYVTIGYGGQILFLSLLLTTASGENAVVFICLATSFGAFAASGFYPNCFEIAPNYTAVINGIFQFSCGLSAIISSILNSYIVKNGTLAEWHSVFLIMIMSFLLGNILYCIFGSSEVQSWSEDNTEDKILMLEEPK